MTLWTQFLKALPAGPWRGQARVAVADLLLDQLDLAGATEQIRQAAAILDNLPPSADSSWPESAPDIRLRQGILALLAGQSEPAVTALDLATHSPRLPGEGKGGEGGRERTLAVRRQEAASRSGPSWARPIAGAGLALGLARIAALMGARTRPLRSSRPCNRAGSKARPQSRPRLPVREWHARWWRRMTCAAREGSLSGKSQGK